MKIALLVVRNPGSLLLYKLQMYLLDCFSFFRFPAAAQQPRDEPTKSRTRVAARSVLFSSFSDDLRRVIGLETARSGLLMMFDMLQHPVLNKRLAIVLLVRH